jgi:hypothetical protein
MEGGKAGNKTLAASTAKDRIGSFNSGAAKILNLST